MIEKTGWKPFPDFLTIEKSEIEGLGLFTLKDLDKAIDLAPEDPLYYNNRGDFYRIYQYKYDLFFL